MPRYIDADALDELVVITINNKPVVPYSRIKEMKGEDVAPVVHAHWRRMLNYDVLCSKCQYVLPSGSPVSDFRFCPHCGSKMDEKVVEE